MSTSTTARGSILRSVVRLPLLVASETSALLANLRRSWRILGIFWLAALVLWLAVTGLAWHAERNLGNASVITGYALFAVILSLAFFKARKRLLELPLVFRRTVWNARWQVFLFERGWSVPAISLQPAVDAMFKLRAHIDLAAVASAA